MRNKGSKSKDKLSIKMVRILSIIYNNACFLISAETIQPWILVLFNLACSLLHGPRGIFQSLTFLCSILFQHSFTSTKSKQEKYSLFRGGGMGISPLDRWNLRFSVFFLTPMDDEPLKKYLLESESFWHCSFIKLH